MKFTHACVLGVILAACSSPRYVYYFPQPVSLPVEAIKAGQPVLISPPEKKELQASADKMVMPSVQRQQKADLVSQDALITSSPGKPAMTMAQPVPAGPPDAAGVSDSTFRLSLLFLVGGLILWAIGGPVFTVIGSLAMLTGVVFGIKWFYKK